MTQQTIDLHVNPSGETIRLGPLAVRFLLTGDDSTGSIAAKDRHSSHHAYTAMRYTL